MSIRAAVSSAAAVLLFAAAVRAADLPAASAPGPQSDGEIAGVVAAANQGELDAAAIALRKSKNKDVMKFAAMMRRDHTAAKRQLMKTGVSPVDSDRSTDLKAKAKDEAGRLDMADEGKLDADYMDAQVDDHSNLLKALDEELIPKAKSAKLGEFLKKVRVTVAQHLEEARRVQGMLKSKKS